MQINPEVLKVRPLWKYSLITKDLCTHNWKKFWHVALSQVFVMFWQVTEIYNFTQDDLMTEDIFIVDCHSEIFVWVGQEVVPKNKLLALTIGEVRFIRHIANRTLERISLKRSWNLRQKLLIYLYFVSLEIHRERLSPGKVIPWSPYICDHGRWWAKFLHPVFHFLGFLKISCK